MKQTKQELAVLGGAQAFAQPLHVGRPNVGNRDRILSLINGMLDRRWLSNQGPLVQEFERRVAETAGVRHCVAMCNGTVALEIAIRALGLHGEVILPSYTFIATAHALQWQEITPVFCDIDPHTHTLDPNRVEALITPRTTGIIGVHIWGRGCLAEPLAEIAQRRGLKLMFDAAHAFGCSHEGRMIGGFGDAEVFSFHATKFVNSGEGGAVVTNDDELAEKMRLMRNFGFGGLDRVVYIGTNGKMSEFHAAMGLASLDSLPDFIAKNRENYELYRRELASVPGLSVINYDSDEQCNYQYIVVEIDPYLTGLSRDELLETLIAENILARRYFWPGCHRMEPYKSYFPNARLVLRATEAVSERVLLLPTGTTISATDIQDIAQVLRLATSAAAEVRRALTLKHVPTDRRDQPPERRVA